jgi:hypothetical protein
MAIVSIPTYVDPRTGIKIPVISTGKVPGMSDAVLQDTAEKALDIEQQIPKGGSVHTYYEKDHYLHIGTIVNTTPAIRILDNAKFAPTKVSIDPFGSYVKNEPVPYTETVENTRWPCGTYSVQVSNRYDLSVGNGGIGISTGGNMHMGCGGRYNISAKHELNLSSGSGNLNIRAERGVTIESNSLSLKTRDATSQVMIDGNLGVAKNTVINGCAFVDGEVYLSHVTCPAEVQYTGGGMGSFGQLMVNAGLDGKLKGATGGTVIGWADMSYIKKLYESILPGNFLTSIAKLPWNLPDKVPVLVFSTPTNVASVAGNGGIKSNPEYSVFVYPHEHPFNNIPCTFTTGHAGVRNKANIAMNSGNVVNAGKIVHGYKQPIL